MNPFEYLHFFGQTCTQGSPSLSLNGNKKKLKWNVYLSSDIQSCGKSIKWLNGALYVCLAAFLRQKWRAKKKKKFIKSKSNQIKLLMRRQQRKSELGRRCMLEIGTVLIKIWLRLYKIFAHASVYSSNQILQLINFFYWKIEKKNEESTQTFNDVLIKELSWWAIRERIKLICNKNSAYAKMRFLSEI
jgi:hypothetical protein